MSTNKTPNLHLHAWEETDTFSRSEFNENFAAIDAAYGALDAAVGANAAALDAAGDALNRQIENVSRWKTIKQFTVTSATTAYSCNLRDINWNDWNYVAVSGDYCGSAALTASIYTSAGSRTAGTTTGPLLLLFFPLHDSSRSLKTLLISSPSADLRQFEDSLSDVTQLYLNRSNNNATVPAGYRIVVRGLA